MTEDGHIIEQRIDEFKAAARAAGLKLTPQRLAIYRAVANRDDHPSAEAVYNAIHDELPTVSLDTVYRTLWTLTRLGLIQTLGPRQEAVRFDANLSRHHHFVCARCGLTRDLVSEELNALAVPAEAMKFGHALAAHVEVRGVCTACAAADREAAHPNRASAPRPKRAALESENATPAPAARRVRAGRATQAL